MTPPSIGAVRRSLGAPGASQVHNTVRPSRSESHVCENDALVTIVLRAGELGSRSKQRRSARRERGLAAENEELDGLELTNGELERCSVAGAPEAIDEIFALLGLVDWPDEPFDAGRPDPRVGRSDQFDSLV